MKADVASTGATVAGVRWFGRVDLTNEARPRFAWSGTGFVARFQGAGLRVALAGSRALLFKTVVDGVPQPPFTTAVGQASYDLAANLPAGLHTVELYKQSEGALGEADLADITVTGGLLLDPPPPAPRRIEVVGDSISCGYGALGTLADSDCYATESHWHSYGAVAARALGAELSTVAVAGHGLYRNYDGTTANALPQLYGRTITNDPSSTWSFAFQPDAVVINLGTNDINGGKGDPGAPFYAAYLDFLETVRGRYPAALIICLVAPLLGGTDLDIIRGYITAAVAARQSAGDTGVEHFTGIDQQTPDKAACSYHPNSAQHALMGAQLADELRVCLGW
jgi:lysophospholipase L1-like esterase